MCVANGVVTMVDNTGGSRSGKGDDDDNDVHYNCDDDVYIGNNNTLIVPIMQITSVLRAHNSMTSQQSNHKHTKAESETDI